MIHHLKRIVLFYAGWRLPLVAIAVTLAYIGLATDRWWSALVGVLGVVPLLALHAFTASRTAEVGQKVAEHGHRISASETRLGHGEDRDQSFENQFAALDKKLTRLAGATARAPQQPATGSKRHQAIKNQNVITGQVMLLHRLVTGADVGPGTPLVTVVVPCFNESRFISDAIESLQGQTFANFVVVIVDDASETIGSTSCDTPKTPASVLREIRVFAWPRPSMSVFWMATISSISIILKSEFAISLGFTTKERSLASFLASSRSLNMYVSATQAHPDRPDIDRSTRTTSLRAGHAPSTATRRYCGLMS
jgi:hypothetical protein